MWVAQLGAILLSLVSLHVSSVALLASVLGAQQSKISIGFGPLVFSRTVGGIRLQLGLFPLGGFVQFGDEGERFEALSPARRC